MTDEQMMLMLRLAFHAGVHRGETTERKRLGNLQPEYIAPDFEEFFKGINPFRIDAKDAGKGGYVVD